MVKKIENIVTNNKLQGKGCLKKIKKVKVNKGHLCQFKLLESHRKTLIFAPYKPKQTQKIHFLPP